MVLAAPPAPMIPIRITRPCGIVAEILYAVRNLSKSPRSRSPIAGVHARAHLPQRKGPSRSDHYGQSLETGGHHRRAETESACGRLVEPVSAGQGTWRRPD